MSDTKQAMTMIHTALLIDDEPLDQKVYRRVLERSGLVSTVLTYGDPQSGLGALLAPPAGARIEAVFLDLHMPRMSGFEFLAELDEKAGARYAALQVILLTAASVTPQDKARANAFRMITAFERKPLTPNAVEQIAQRVARQKAAQADAASNPMPGPGPGQEGA